MLAQAYLCVWVRLLERQQNLGSAFSERHGVEPGGEELRGFAHALDGGAAHHHRAEHVHASPEPKRHADAVAGALGRPHDDQDVEVVYGVFVATVSTTALPPRRLPP